MRSSTCWVHFRIRPASCACRGSADDTSWRTGRAGSCSNMKTSLFSRCTPRRQSGPDAGHSSAAPCCCGVRFGRSFTTKSSRCSPRAKSYLLNWHRSWRLLRDLGEAFVGNIEDRAAGFAMHRIRIVALQGACWAGKPHLGGAYQRAGEIEKEGHAENHDSNRGQAANCAPQSDVAKTSRRQRRNREIQRVGIVRDLIIAKFLGFINDNGHDEDEHRKVGDSKNDFLITLEERASSAQPFQHLVVSQQP